MNQSSKWSGVTWDLAGANHLPDASGSDLWHTCWCNDGHLYSIWGDGGGFTGSNTLGRVEWGVARIEGSTYAARSAYNVYGGNNPESEESPVQGDDPASWKVYDVINVGSWFFAAQADWGFTGSGYYRWRYIKSSDKGAHWTLKDGSAIDQNTWEVASWNTAAAGGRPHLINVGKGYEYTPFSGYAIGYRDSSGGGMMVCRVPFDGITSRGAYEYYVDSATWTRSWHNGTIVRSFAAADDPCNVYLPNFERYISTIPTDNNGSFVMLDAPSFVGPWTIVGTWGNFIDAGRKFYYLPIDKWCSSGSNEFRMSFSGTNSYDNWWTVKGTFNTYSSSGSDPGSSNPGSYSVSSWSTYTGSQSWVKEVDAADLGGWVTGTHISSGAIETPHLAANAVVASKILGGEIKALLLTTDKVTAGCIEAGAVGADEIAANAIAVRHLVVADFSNICMNGDFDANSGGVADNWSLYNGARRIWYPDAPPSGNCLDMDGIMASAYQTQGTNTGSLSYFPVAFGESYFLSAFGSRYGTPDSNLYVGLRVETDPTSVSWHTIVQTPGCAGGWPRFSGTVTMPTSARRATVVAYNDVSVGSAHWLCAQIAVRRASNAEMIVDGAITAEKVGANEIIAQSANIKDGIIGGVKISSGTITANHIGTNEIIAQTANIKDAVVTTLKIGLNAVTVPVAASGNLGWTVYGDLTCVGTWSIMHVGSMTSWFVGAYSNPVPAGNAFKFTIVATFANGTSNNRTWWAGYESSFQAEVSGIENIIPSSGEAKYTAYASIATSVAGGLYIIGWNFYGHEAMR